ncbi:MAG: hypothetical protein JWN86_3874 [Planctomycetota bacterium]|nr:hypothetical protein [Planctomycetota bacterium]
MAISLRALLLLVLILGVLLGWRVNKARDQRRAVGAIYDYGGFVYYDWEFVNRRYTSGRQPPGPGWLRGWLGDEYFQDVTVVSLSDNLFRLKTRPTLDSVLTHAKTMGRLEYLDLRGNQLTDAHLARIRDLTTLESLWIQASGGLTDNGVAQLKIMTNITSLHLENATITGRGLDHLAEIPKLEELHVPGNRFIDADLASLSRMPHLKRLDVGGRSSEITDEGMKLIGNITTLEFVGIQDTNTSDAGLNRLRSLPNLKELRTGRSKITPEGIQRFQADRPGVKIVP